MLLLLLGCQDQNLSKLSDAEIAAITTHERSSWGNDAPEVTEEDVKKIRELITNELNQ